MEKGYTEGQMRASEKACGLFLLVGLFELK